MGISHYWQKQTLLLHFSRLENNKKTIVLTTTNVHHFSTTSFDTLQGVPTDLGFQLIQIEIFHKISFVLKEKLVRYC